MNYQFTRAFSARVIVEYDSVLANRRRRRCKNEAGEFGGFVDLAAASGDGGISGI